MELFANSGDPDQTPRSAASDLGLHCLPVTRLGFSGLQLINRFFTCRCALMSTSLATDNRL